VTEKLANGFALGGALYYNEVFAHAFSFITALRYQFLCLIV
jgi:hypothetical protein